LPAKSKSTVLVPIIVIYKKNNMPRITPRQAQIRRNQEKFGSIFDKEDNEMERGGWMSIIVFALIFIGIGAGLTVCIVELII
jgi:hypothetical protein